MFTYVAKRLDALFVVVLARVFNELCTTPVELPDQFKGQTSQFLVPAAFAWVISHTHFNCTHNKTSSRAHAKATTPGTPK